MKSVKTLYAAFLGLLAATPSLAGGLAEPVMEPSVVAQETTASSRAGIIVPILAILLVGLALSGGGNDTPPIIED